MRCPGLAPRFFSLVLGWLSAALLGLAASYVPPPSITRPNIVFILTDDLGVYDLHRYGRVEHHTPFLDRLADEGTRFTSAYCAQPICSPSRAALLTGKTPARLHLTTYLPGRPDCASQRLLHPAIQPELELRHQTIAEHLREAGYATACIGKWHVGGEGFGPQYQGFEVVYAGKAVTTPSPTEGGKGEYELTAHAAAFIEANRERPFFLYLAHDTPHIPYSAQPHRLAANPSAFEPTYAALIETLDDTVGRLLAKIEELGLRERTLVIFTSDNGGLHVPEGPHRRVTHNGPFRAGKGYLYEGGLRVPLIVRWPGHVPARRTLETPVINTDWLPTLLELCNLRTPDDLDGVSFAPLLLGTSNPPTPSRRFFWHFPHYTNQGGQPGGAIRDGRWKLIENYEDGRCELYDLVNDPGEVLDVARLHPQRVGQLQRRLAAWRQTVGAQTNAPNPNVNPSLHRALYVDCVPSRFSPFSATPADWLQIGEWRRQMDAAVANSSRRQ